MYHLQFSLQVASPETFGYSLLYPPVIKHRRMLAYTDSSNKNLQAFLTSIMEE
jgi:hypothetical protein